jgi:N-acetylglucosaminyldiphosphoundecaprenol N-acetyl-beta-D-mannosaminyltransferase
MKVSLLGVDMHPLTIPELHICLRDVVSQGKQIVIANHNLHSVYLYHTDAEMRAFYKQAEIVHIDGMPWFSGRG